MKKIILCSLALLFLSSVKIYTAANTVNEMMEDWEDVGKPEYLKVKEELEK